MVNLLDGGRVRSLGLAVLCLCTMNTLHAQSPGKPIGSAAPPHSVLPAQRSAPPLAAPELARPAAEWVQPLPAMPERVIYSPVTVTPFASLPPKASRRVRQAKIEQLEQTLYLRVERPRVLGDLDARIRVAEAEVDSYRRVLRDYEAFTRFKFSSPLLVSIERTRLALVEAEARLKTLRNERSRYLRYTRTARALDQLKAGQ